MCLTAGGGQEAVLERRPAHQALSEVPVGSHSRELPLPPLPPLLLHLPPPGRSQWLGGKGRGRLVFSPQATCSRQLSKLLPPSTSVHTLLSSAHWLQLLEHIDILPASICGGQIKRDSHGKGRPREGRGEAIEHTRSTEPPTQRRFCTVLTLRNIHVVFTRLHCRTAIVQ